MFKLFLSMFLLASVILGDEIDELPKEVKDCMDKLRPMFARQLAGVEKCDKLPGIRNEDESAYEAYQNCVGEVYEELQTDILQSPDVEPCLKLTESLSPAQVDAAYKYLYNFARPE